MGPIYPRLLARFSSARTVQALQSGIQQLPALAVELAREVTLFGTYEEGPEQIAAWMAAGADSVQLVLPPGRPEAELAELVEVAATIHQLR
jgi:alkanesulfonate monooxygenase SsuD/methylene tetrahydromethanopterin reductase-like flavin-dependent oxidoreductase (luciferase family)